MRLYSGLGIILQVDSSPDLVAVGQKLYVACFTLDQVQSDLLKKLSWENDGVTWVFDLEKENGETRNADAGAKV